MTQFRELPSVRDFSEQITFRDDEEEGLPELYFDLEYIEFVKDNYSLLPGQEFS
jgi:Uso1 / p115 like vesicle tethering protein, head region